MYSSRKHHSQHNPIQAKAQLSTNHSPLKATFIIIVKESTERCLVKKHSDLVALDDPLCKNTCRYCRCRPCDVGIEHDDHTCCDCEQRLLHPEGVPGAPWQPPLTPGCESWCTQCTSQRCAVRGLHDLHMCMGCERAMTFSTPVGGGDPWAAPE